ncbi:MAG: hypothetical protein U5L11_05830 [Arhodomonas sp.]|nr:hypothetical protein [Arhodomonas sp.]
MLNFKESLSVLLISGLFVLLAARLDPIELLALGWGAVALLAFMQLVGRPLNVLVSTAGSSLDWREQAFRAGLRPGASLRRPFRQVFALRLEASGFAGGRGPCAADFPGDCVHGGTAERHGAAAGGMVGAAGAAATGGPHRRRQPRGP